MPRKSGNFSIDDCELKQRGKGTSGSVRIGEEEIIVGRWHGQSLLRTDFKTYLVVMEEKLRRW